MPDSRWFGAQASRVCELKLNALAALDTTSTAVGVVPYLGRLQPASAVTLLRCSIQYSSYSTQHKHTAPAVIQVYALSIASVQRTTAALCAV